MAADDSGAGSARVQARTDDREQVLKTYRYLRLAMVALAVVLGASVVYQSVRAGEVLNSISAYYYTPARSVFVASLVAIGVGLVALQGRTRVEDAVLNLAGMFAPVVAFVPTPEGRPVSLSQRVVDAEVDNNLTALLVGAVVSVVLVAVVAGSQLDEQGNRRRMRGGDRIGVLVGILVIAGGVVWFARWHAAFVADAHYVAAGAMFTMIAVAVLINTRSGHHNRSYAAIFALMLLVQLVWLSYPAFAHAVLVVEAAMITLFAVFWLLQTWDLRYADVVGTPPPAGTA